MARRLIGVVGPTASGKSALALRLAEAAGGEIVSCDSLQVYRGCDVGSAKPTPADQARVRHHGIDVVDPDEPFNAADWAALARAALGDISRRGRLPIVAGGTGLYLRALVHGLFAGPGRDPDRRPRLERMAARYGAPRLHRLLRRADPETAARVKPADRVRVVRALEVLGASGRRISSMQRDATSGLEGWEVRLVGLDPDRATLRRAVEARTDAMFEGGLLGEVQRLLARYPREVKPLQAIGYRQAVAVLRGEQEVATARRDIVTATMRYAKRQRTWFRHQASAEWFADPGEAFAAAASWRRGEARG